MMGEELNATNVTEHGLVGDRVFALIDKASGKVASAKNPKKWGTLFSFRASFVEPSVTEVRSVRITLPDGRLTTSDQPETDGLLSEALGTQVNLVTSSEKPSYEEYWPDMEGLANRDKVTEELMPPHTFFDLATVHILTTATMNSLRGFYPEGRFEARRFRPNIVIETPANANGFVENAWVNRSIHVGDRVRLKIISTCTRCVMTTLAQGDLPQDLGILRTAAKHNKLSVGAYATVELSGRVKRGDSIWLD